MKIQNLLWVSASALLINAILPTTSLAVAPSDTPKVTIISPSATKEITPDAPFEIVFNLTGGWATNTSTCAPKDLNRTGFVFALAQFDKDGNSNALFWGGYTYKTLGNVRTLTSKVLTNGVQCTLRILETNENTWESDWLRSDYTHTTREILGIEPVEGQKAGEITRIVFGLAPWEDPQSSQLFEFRTGPAGSPKLEILGLSRGEEIDFGKKFQVRVVVGKENKLQEKLNVSGADGSECGKLSLLTTSSTHNTYISECVLRSDSPNLAREVQAYIYTVDGRLFRSNSVTVNFINSGIPKLEVSVAGTNEFAPESKPGKGTVVLVRARGNLRITGGNQTTGLADRVVNLCIFEKCVETKLDSDGSFSHVFKSSELLLEVVARMKVGNLDLIAVTGPIRYDEEVKEPEVVLYKAGMPKGKVDKKSQVYKTSVNFGKNFKKVSSPNETATKQCGRAQSMGIILANGRIQHLGSQAELIKSYLRTASGYKGCIDGFGK